MLKKKKKQVKQQKAIKEVIIIRELEAKVEIIILL